MLHHAPTFERRSLRDATRGRVATLGPRAPGAPWVRRSGRVRPRPPTALRSARGSRRSPARAASIRRHRRARALASDAGPRWHEHASAERRKSHSIGSSPGLARAWATVLRATGSRFPLRGSARSSLSTTSEIGRSRISAMPRTNQTTCSAGNRRRRTVAVPVAKSASSIHSVGRSC